MAGPWHRAKCRKIILGHGGGQVYESGAATRLSTE